MERGADLWASCEDRLSCRKKEMVIQIAFPDSEEFTHMTTVSEFGVIFHAL